MKKLFTLLAAGALLFSCGPKNNQDFSENFKKLEDISLMKGDKTLITYSPEQYQIVYNVKNGDYMLCDDTMNTFFIVKILSGDLDSGQSPATVKADLTYSFEKEPITTLSNVSFEVLQTTVKGDLKLYYLYSKTNLLGVVIAGE